MPEHDTIDVGFFINPLIGDEFCTKFLLFQNLYVQDDQFQQSECI